MYNLVNWEGTFASHELREYFSHFQDQIAGQYIVRWTSVLSNRFDTTGFKKVYGDLYKAFTKQTSSRRFSISC